MLKRSSAIGYMMYCMLMCGLYNKAMADDYFIIPKALEEKIAQKTAPISPENYKNLSPEVESKFIQSLVDDVREFVTINYAYKENKLQKLLRDIAGNVKKILNDPFKITASLSRIALEAAQKDALRSAKKYADSIVDNALLYYLVPQNDVKKDELLKNIVDATFSKMHQIWVTAQPPMATLISIKKALFARNKKDPLEKTIQELADVIINTSFTNLLFDEKNQFIKRVQSELADIKPAKNQALLKKARNDLYYVLALYADPITQGFTHLPQEKFPAIEVLPIVAQATKLIAQKLAAFDILALDPQDLSVLLAQLKNLQKPSYITQNYFVAAENLLNNEILYAIAEQLAKERPEMTLHEIKNQIKISRLLINELNTLIKDYPAATQFALNQATIFIKKLESKKKELKSFA